MKRLISFLALAGVPCAVMAAPFGIEQGTPVASLNVLDQIGEVSFLVDPPTINAAFGEYVVMATAAQGVCAVTARSRPYADFDDARGMQRRLALVLAKYGPPREVKPGKDAPLLYMTPKDFPLEWKGKLPYRLSSIVLETVQEGSSFIVQTSYFYQNMRECAASQANLDARGL